MSLSAKYALTVALRSTPAPGNWPQLPSGRCWFRERRPAVSAIAHGGAFLRENELHQQVFAFEDGIAFQFAAPVAVRFLQREQGIDGTAQRAGEARALGFGQGWRMSGRTHALDCTGLRRHTSDGLKPVCLCV